VTVPVSGTLVAFEGGEGTGKTTQVALLASWLRERGYPVLVTREPGGTGLGQGVRSLLLDPAASITSRAELLLYSADRAQHVAEVLRPALDRGEVVLTDRYIDSTLAYQGAGRDLPDADVRAVTRFATGGLQPDLTVLLDLDPEEGLRRAAGRSAPDRLEADRPPFHRAVRDAFLALAAADPARYLVLDAGAEVTIIEAEIQAAVLARLPARNIS
jgi:dTMP kinase